ncbi:hypothetical protein [Candidatus Nitrosocosmicus sp. FF01]|uniref:hypothetical protein n=1 Tax=Candidatus Nitrosocosmicus sp. FF01 TaxID=3397670 RepID=UPI0039E78A24
MTKPITLVIMMVTRLGTWLYDYVGSPKEALKYAAVQLLGVRFVVVSCKVILNKNNF